MERASKYLLTCILISLLPGCDQNRQESQWQTSGTPATEQTGEPLLTLADVNPDTPTRRLSRLRPLADHIAQQMGWQPEAIEIHVGQSIAEVSVMLAEGSIDMLIDSSYPSIMASQHTGSRIILESVVDDQRKYQSILITGADSPVMALDDLRDRTVAFQERYSTSGYLLPAALLIDRGYALSHAAGLKARPEPGHIGFIFSGDEENTLSLIRRGIVDAGALSSHDYDNLPESIKAEFRVLTLSEAVPRKFVSVKPDINPETLASLKNILVSISEQDQQQMAAQGGWEWEFIELDEQSQAGVATIERMMKTLAVVDLD